MQLSLFDSQRIVVTAVCTQESLAAGVIPVDRGSSQPHPGVAGDIVQVNTAALSRQIVLDGDAQEVIPGQLPPHDEEGILQVDRVLKGIPLVGELAKGEKREVARPVALIGDLEPPVFEGLVERDKVGGFGRDPRIV